MNICFFNDISFVGGGEHWVMRACKYLETADHRGFVVCPHPSDLHAACQQEGIPVFGYSLHLVTGYPFFEALYSYLSENEVDVLYCTVMGRFCEARVLEQLAKRLNENREGRPPVIIILKTGLPPMDNLAPEYYGAGSGKLVRRLHVVSKSIKEAFGLWQPQMDKGFVELLYEGCDTEHYNREKFNKQECREFWQVPHGHTVISCVARLDGMKGQSVLLRSVTAILQQFPQTTFLLAGDGKDRDMLEELSDDLNIRNNLRILGNIKNVPALLAATDILCHPSLNDGIPNSIIEAMAMEIPVVASNLPGIAEVITNEETGTLVRPNDVAACTQALLHTLRNPGQALEMAASAKEKIAAGFNFKKNMDSLLAGLAAEQKKMQGKTVRGIAPKNTGVNHSVNILFLMSEIRMGGEETELGILARYLDRKKYQLSVLCCRASDEYAPVLEKLHYYNVPVDFSCNRIYTDEGKVHYIIEKIKRDNIGIVVACQDTQYACEVFKQLSPNECKLVEHGGTVEEAARITKKYTARYVGVSRAITDAAAARMKKPANARFIPSMVDIDEYVNPDWAPARQMTKDWLHQTLLQPFGYGDDACVVIFVGRLDPKKHVEDLIEAARLLETDCPEAFFLVVGGNDSFEYEYGEKLVAGAADLVARNRLAFTGPRSDIAGLLSASDILVLPSTGEGMAHVINEAGAAGLAVIATNDGAAAEQLENGNCGIVTTPRDIHELAGALRKLVKNKTLRKELGQKLHEKVKVEYTASVVVEQWHSLFGGLAGELKKPPRIRMLPADEVLPFPLEIQIQTTTACNATCIMCPHPVVSKEVSMGHMTEAMYRNILEQCAAEPSIRRIEPFLMAEPFVDKRMVDFIALAKEIVPQADVTVTTNGSMVTPAVSDRMVASGLDAIWFSFNGATKETYEKIMGVSYQTVMNNIQYLLKIKPESLKVFVNMIETKPMRDEIDTNIAYWKSMGVEAGPSPLVNRAGNVDDYNELNYKPVAEKPVRVCDLPYHKIYILYNGDVVLCCMDWRRQVVLGNVAQQSIRDIWLGEQYRRIREKLTHRKVQELELCSTCSYTYT